MKRLIKDGKVILDGTLPQYKKQEQANRLLQYIEGLFQKYEIKTLVELEEILKNYRKRD